MSRTLEMNTTQRQDTFDEAFAKNFITIALGVFINCINGLFVYTFFRGTVFQQDTRYVLYIHLVINDMIMLTFSIVLQVATYTVHLSLAACSAMLLILVTTNRNSPLNLAGMAVERYIAVCRPLQHAQICTMRRTYVLILLIWGVSLTPCLADILISLANRPLSVFSEMVLCHNNLVYTMPQHKANNLAVQVIYFSFVFLTLAITYIKVLLAAMAVSSADRRSARKARNTILLHGIQLLICMLTYISSFINVLLLAARPSDRTKILFVSFLVTNTLPRLLNPLIYGVRDQRFVSHMRLYLSCRRCSASTNKVKPKAALRPS